MDAVARVRAVETLLDWYMQHHRKLPWRKPPPSQGSGGDDDDVDRGYIVWVSEIMCQQTRVSTVIGFVRMVFVVGTKWLTHCTVCSFNTTDTLSDGW